ncbi:hypothetical protein AAG906_009817 [Vitis piasezkii]
MAFWVTTFLLLLSFTISVACNEELKAVQTARFGLLQGGRWARSSLRLHGLNLVDSGYVGEALGDCVKLYEESESRLTRLLSGETRNCDDARTWLSSALASHRTCLDGLEGKGMAEAPMARNLTVWLSEALALYAKYKEPDTDAEKEVQPTLKPSQNEVMLAEWSPKTSKADIVVAKDGSGNHMTINEAVAALTRMVHKRTQRVVVYVKSGIYNEKVEIGKNLNNVMFVGDGVDKTIITADRNVHDGATTPSSATFGVSGDGFWAKDITFENRAGPHKHQAVAMRVSSDLSVFYRCSFKGYQDTLYVHSNRQFFRDCHVYGTIDFIFGNAAVVFQNCDIYVRKPMNRQSNMITAQGRDIPEEPTGISVQGFESSFKSFLGRPWKRYSRTVFLETDLDGLIDPRGWTEWSGNYGLSTLYYGSIIIQVMEHRQGTRVKWPGFHVLNGAEDAMPFTVSRFIQGEKWIPASGVPFSPGI